MSFSARSAANLVSIGLDSVEVPRLAAILARRPGLSERLFSPLEREFASTLTNPTPSLAARFAAKEATMKALGVGIGAVDWTDISVVRQVPDPPHLVVAGRAARLAAERGITGWLVSLTHTASIASAVVAGLG